MAKQYHYLYYSNSDFAEHGAHLGHHANSANAVANLGYASLLAYHDWLPAIALPRLLRPFAPQAPEVEIAQRYRLQEHLQVLKLPVPWPFGQISHKLTATSTLICKYYLPTFIKPAVETVHSRDWNFIQAAVKHKIPAVYEHHHFVDRRFDPAIVNSPFLRLAVTVSPPIAESMVATGMPAEKIVMLHSGFNRQFLPRDPVGAEQWRQKLLSQSTAQKLVVYAGGLHRFKGVDLLIQVAQQLPEVQFAIAGGNASQQQHYQQQVDALKLSNVKLLGCLSHTELPPLLQAADVLAHPHLANQEATYTSPLKFFEYMAAGTPIVAAKIVTLAEFVSSPAVAVWCEPDDVADFAKGIVAALAKYPRQPEGYSEMLQFVEQYSWESRMAKILTYVE